jgi:crossover junction endodeoxyribonuclease RuvC
MTLIIGIDPGADGALAAIRDGKQMIYRFKNQSEREICRSVSSFMLDDCRVFLEKVHAAPGQGVSSMFNFGTGYGFLRGVLTACGLPFEDVPPQAWQQKLGIGKKYESPAARKRAHKALAERLFPQLDINLSNCDALLIAEYGYRVMNGR